MSLCTPLENRCIAEDVGVGDDGDDSQATDNQAENDDQAAEPAAAETSGWVLDAGSDAGSQAGSPQQTSCACETRPGRRGSGPASGALFILLFVALSYSRQRLNHIR